MAKSRGETPTRSSWNRHVLFLLLVLVAVWKDAAAAFRPFGIAVRSRRQDTGPYLQNNGHDEERHHHQIKTLLRDQNQDGGGEGNNPLDFLFNPYESKIPKEIEQQIYEAEGNTAAAKDRGSRIAAYAVIAAVGVLIAFFNGFLTELRTGPVPDEAVPFDLDTSAFSWVNSNILFRFIFLNKIGGGICLLGGAGAGLLAEAEYDSRRINAEKIFEEMQRRRAEAASSGGGSKKDGKRRKKRQSGRDKKRLGALAEVVDTTQVEEEAPPVVPAATTTAEVTSDAAKPKEEDDGGGLLGTIKGFYDKADTMAASQALMLNKQLEDAGVVEKITDESGLRVIGREAAAKIEQGEKETTKEKSP